MHELQRVEAGAHVGARLVAQHLQSAQVGADALGPRHVAESVGDGGNAAKHDMGNGRVDTSEHVALRDRGA